jgi:hypothetical protein
MKRISSNLSIIICTFFLQSCAIYAVYGTLQAINHINNVLNMVCTSMNTIHTILSEGTNIKRAARDGELIRTLADRIPGLVAGHFEQAVAEKINLFSGDLKTTAIAFTQHAVDENLAGARQSYNTLSTVYNRFSDLLVELERAASPMPELPEIGPELEEENPLAP